MNEVYKVVEKFIMATKTPSDKDICLFPHNT